MHETTDIGPKIAHIRRSLVQVKYLWGASPPPAITCIRDLSSCMGLTGNVPSLFPFLNPYMVEPSANQGATLKRVSEGFSHYGSEANNPAWPVHIPLCRICFHGTSGLSSILCTGKPAQFSPHSIRLCCLGCTPHPDRCSSL